MSDGTFEPGEILTGASGKQYVLGDLLGVFGGNSPCDAPSATVSMVDGHCRCIVCSRCGHHTGDTNQGHLWAWCKVTQGMREPHFCCPGSCQLEAGECLECQGTGIVYVETDCGGCSDWPGIPHEPACGVEPCPRGCEVPSTDALPKRQED